MKANTFIFGEGKQTEEDLKKMVNLNMAEMDVYRGEKKLGIYFKSGEMNETQYSF